MNELRKAAKKKKELFVVYIYAYVYIRVRGERGARPERRHLFLRERVRWRWPGTVTWVAQRTRVLLRRRRLSVGSPRLRVNCKSEFRGTERTDRRRITRSTFSIQEVGSETAILNGKDASRRLWKDKWSA